MISAQTANAVRPAVLDGSAREAESRSARISLDSATGYPARHPLRLLPPMLSTIHPARLLLPLAIVACAPAAPSPSEFRARAERVAQDTASRAWRHEVGVDSVRMHGDTAVVWVSPRKWMATDAPQAGVHVAPDARIVAIQWISGG